MVPTTSLISVNISTIANDDANANNRQRERDVRTTLPSRVCALVKPTMLKATIETSSCLVACGNDGATCSSLRGAKTRSKKASAQNDTDRTMAGERACERSASLRALWASASLSTRRSSRSASTCAAAMSAQRRASAIDETDLARQHDEDRLLFGRQRARLAADDAEDAERRAVGAVEHCRGVVANVRLGDDKRMAPEAHVGVGVGDLKDLVVGQVLGNRPAAHRHVARRAIERQADVGLELCMCERAFA